MARGDREKKAVLTFSTSRSICLIRMVCWRRRSSFGLVAVFRAPVLARAMAAALAAVAVAMELLR